MNESNYILLAEDNPDEALLTIRTLKKNNACKNVTHFRDGEEVMNYLSPQLTHLPKLILLDLKMPKLDGIDVLKRIKADDRLCTIPVVMLTSSKEESDIVRSYKLGVNAYIVKPVNTENFVKAVNDIGLFWLSLNTTYP